jgi:hypothetical protein
MYLDNSLTTSAKSGLEYLIRNYIIPTPGKANPMTFDSNYRENLPNDVDFGNFSFVIDACYVAGASLIF